jgi:hypothetical protein
MRSRRMATSSRMLLPNRKASPWVGASRPDRQLMRVDLPAAFWPANTRKTQKQSLQQLHETFVDRALNTTAACTRTENGGQAVGLNGHRHLLTHKSADKVQTTHTGE